MENYKLLLMTAEDKNLAAIFFKARSQQNLSIIESLSSLIKGEGFIMSADYFS